MKPPVVHDERPRLWTTGAIFGVAGILLAIVEHPLVPLSYVFHLIPIAIGGAVGTAVLREKYGPKAIAAYALFILWLAAATIAHQTSVAPVFLAAGVFSLTRAIMKTVDF
ncbi:hypothetical protein EON82_17835 [bacterium]|nr:MAG: hypothetical protein EON82_17835 [bacterium]